MSACVQIEPIASPAEQNTNKCALKLMGLDFGDLPDEDILEFISNYIQPSAIKALFYDSYNSFYVLHLSDIESTSVLIGKTLQIETYHITFLPLFDSFVIGNVYLSLSNSQLRNIFSVFGNVFEVGNHHILPNSSKFFHVLSGTREISFLLPGCDSEVQIPLTVMHPPYIFHVKHLCLGCLKQGHSLINCSNREEEGDASLLNVAKSYSANGNEKNVVINITGEMTFEVAKEMSLDEKLENVSSNMTTIEEQISEKNEELVQEMLNDNSVDVEKSKQIEKVYKEIEKKSEEMEQESIEKLQGIKVSVDKNRKKLKRKLPVEPTNNKNSSSDDSEPDFEHTSSLPRVRLDLPPSVKSCIGKSEGILPTNALLELMYIDARNHGNVIAFVLQFTSNIKAVLVQLRKFQNELVNRPKLLNTGEIRFKEKVRTIIKVLCKFQLN